MIVKHTPMLREAMESWGGVDFLQGMNLEEYNSLLSEGEKLCVHDPEMMQQLAPFLDEVMPGILATAYLAHLAEGATLWVLYPASPSLAKIFGYDIRPTVDHGPIVTRVYRPHGVSVPVCTFSQLWTFEQDMNFRSLMAASGMGGEGDAGDEQST